MRSFVLAAAVLVSSLASAGSAADEVAAMRDICRRSGQGKMIWLESLVRQRADWAGKSGRISVPTFCDCYFDALIKAHGETRTAQLEGSRRNTKPTDGEIMLEAAQKAAADWHCLGIQIDGKPAVPPTAQELIAAAGVKPAVPASSPGYRDVMQATLTAEGVGALKLGMSVADATKLLGPSPAVNAGPATSSYFYGPNRIELQLRANPAGVVIGIYLNRAFTGATDRGIRIKSPLAQVLFKYDDRRKHGAVKVLEEDGVWFGFDSADEVDRLWVEAAPEK